MDIKKLPKLMQDAVESLRQLHNAPNEIAIQAVLGATNLAVQGHYNVDPVIYGVKPISLFLMGIVPTGGAKTTIFDEVCVGIQKFEEEERIRLKNERDNYEIAIKIYEKEFKSYINKKSTPEDYVNMQPDVMQQKLQVMLGNVSSIKKPIVKPSISATYNQPEKPKPVQTADYRIKKGTLNGIIDKLKQQPIVGLASSEGGEFFNSHSMQNSKVSMSTAIEMSSALTAMWDGQPIERLTGMDNTKLFNRRVGMIFLLQEETVRSFMINSMFASQGFTHRFLISQCDTYKKPLVDLSDIGLQKIKNMRSKLQPFHDRIYELISKPFRYIPDTEFELDLVTLEMDNTAKQLWQDFCNTHNQTPTTDLDGYKGFSERLGEHCLRIAANLTAFSQRSAIIAEDMLGAIELMSYYIKQRKNLNIEHTAKDGEKVVIAEKLIKWIIETKFDGTLRELRQFGPCGYRKMDDLQRANVLIEMESIGGIEIYETVAINGKQVKKIRIA